MHDSMPARPSAPPESRRQPGHHAPSRVSLTAAVIVLQRTAGNRAVSTLVVQRGKKAVPQGGAKTNSQDKKKGKSHKSKPATRIPQVVGHDEEPEGTGADVEGHKPTRSEGESEHGQEHRRPDGMDVAVHRPDKGYRDLDAARRTLASLVPLARPRALDEEREGGEPAEKEKEGEEEYASERAIMQSALTKAIERVRGLLADGQRRSEVFRQVFRQRHADAQEVMQAMPQALENWQNNPHLIRIKSLLARLEKRAQTNFGTKVLTLPTVRDLSEQTLIQTVIHEAAHAVDSRVIDYTYDIVGTDLEDNHRVGNAEHYAYAILVHLGKAPPAREPITDRGLLTYQAVCTLVMQARAHIDNVLEDLIVAALGGKISSKIVDGLPGFVPTLSARVGRSVLPNVATIDVDSALHALHLAERLSTVLHARYSWVAQLRPIIGRRIRDPLITCELAEGGELRINPRADLKKLETDILDLALDGTQMTEKQLRGLVKQYERHHSPDAKGGKKDRKGKKPAH